MRSTAGTGNESDSSFCGGRLEKWREIPEGGEFCGKFKAEERSCLMWGVEEESVRNFWWETEWNGPNTEWEVRTVSHET